MDNIKLNLKKQIILNNKINEEVNELRGKRSNLLLILEKKDLIIKSLKMEINDWFNHENEKENDLLVKLIQFQKLNSFFKKNYLKNLIFCFKSIENKSFKRNSKKINKKINLNNIIKIFNKFKFYYFEKIKLYRINNNKKLFFNNLIRIQISFKKCFLSKITAKSLNFKKIKNLNFLLFNIFKKRKWVYFSIFTLKNYNEIFLLECDNKIQKNEILSLNQELDDYHKQIKFWNNKISELTLINKTKNKQLLDNFNIEINDFKAKIESLKIEIDNLKLEKNKEKQWMTEKINKNYSKYKNKNKECEELLIENSNLLANINQIKNENKDLINRYNEIIDTNQALNYDNTDLQNKIVKLKEYESIKASSDWQRLAKEKDYKINELNIKVQQLINEKEELRLNCEQKMKIEGENYDKIFNQNLKYEEDIKKLNKKLNKYQGKYTKNLNEHKSNFIKDITEKSKEIDKLNLEIKNLNLGSDNNKKEILELKEKIKYLEKNKSDFEILKKGIKKKNYQKTMKKSFKKNKEKIQEENEYDDAVDGKFSNILNKYNIDKN